jgi:hypothetical protein
MKLFPAALTPVQAAPFAAQSASQLVSPSRVAMIEKHVSPPAWTAAPSPLDELSAAKTGAAQRSASDAKATMKYASRKHPPLRDRYIAALTD